MRWNYCKNEIFRSGSHIGRETEKLFFINLNGGIMTKINKVDVVNYMCYTIFGLNKAPIV